MHTQPYVSSVHYLFIWKSKTCCCSYFFWDDENERSVLSRALAKPTLLNAIEPYLLSSVQYSSYWKFCSALHLGCTAACVRSLISKIKIKVMQRVPMTEWSTISICCHTGLYRLPSPHVHMTAHVRICISSNRNTAKTEKQRGELWQCTELWAIGKFCCFSCCYDQCNRIYSHIGVPQDSSSTSQYAT